MRDYIISLWLYYVRIRDISMTFFIWALTYQHSFYLRLVENYYFGIRTFQNYVNQVTKKQFKKINNEPVPSATPAWTRV